MIKRTLYFSSPAYLKTKNEQLVFEGGDTGEQKTIPIEDIGVLILDHQQITITQALIAKLLENNVAFITLAFAQLFHVFNMSSVGSHLFVNDVTKNKFVWLAIFFCTGIMVLIYMLPQMRLVLGLVELPVKIWVVCLMSSLLPLLIIQIYKQIFER